MTELPWLEDVPSSRNRYPLNDGERKALAHGEKPSRHTSQIKPGIQRKTGLLPERLRYLIEDVALLHYRHFVREETRRDVQNRLSQLDVVDTVLPRSRTIVPALGQGEQGRAEEGKDWLNTNHSAFSAGSEVGGLLSMLSVQDSEQAAEDFLVGLIASYCATAPDEYGERIASLAERLNNDVKGDEEKLEVQIGGGDVIFNTASPTGRQLERIKTVLRERNLPPADALITEVSLRCESSNVPSTEIEQAVDDILEEYDYSEIEALRERLTNLVADVKKWNYKDTPARDILQIIADRNGPVTSNELDADFEKMRAGLITTVLNRLSDEDHEWGGNTPLVDRTSDGWVLLPMGYLLCLALFNEDEPANILYDFLLSPTLLDEEQKEAVRDALSYA